MPIKKESYIAKYVLESAHKLENFLSRQQKGNKKAEKP
jgi:hypothetical protein